MSYSGLHFEVLKIIALVDVFAGFSIQKNKMLSGLFFFFKKTSTWELTPYVVPEIPKLLKYAADMFKLFSFEEIC